MTDYTVGNNTDHDLTVSLTVYWSRKEVSDHSIENLTSWDPDEVRFVVQEVDHAD